MIILEIGYDSNQKSSLKFPIHRSKMETSKIHVLASFLDTEISELEESSYDDCIFELGNQEYMVLDEYEADQRWEESLDSYIEECILPELSGILANYFDEESWKRDARFDGRGHSLSSYDGCEYEQDEYYIYRLN
jgi:hypothetical protein